MTDLLLIGEGFSPWTEKARWALEHQRLAYDYDEYTPLVSEPWLRIRARRMSGPISVPYLIATDGLSLGDSFAITREADRRRSPHLPPLVPAELEAEIALWNERSERLMRAGRSRILRRTEADRDVAMESLPPFMPKALRPALAGSVRLGTAFLRRKYSVLDVPDDDLVVDLDAIRAAVMKEEPLLGGVFTAADIAIVTALQAVRPHAIEPAGLAPAQRRAWERPELAARYLDVLAWRDAIMAKYRR